MAFKLKLDCIEVAIISDALQLFCAVGDEGDGVTVPSRAEIELVRTKVRQAWFKQDRVLQKLCCPDLRPVPNDDEGSIAHGVLSRGFFARVRDDFVAAVEAGRSKRVPRTE